MLIIVILAVPLLLACLSLLVRRNAVLGPVNTLGHAVVLAAAVGLGMQVLKAKSLFFFGHTVFVDSLSAFFILIIALSDFSAALFSSGYVGREVKDGKIPEKKAGLYYFLLDIFAVSMFCVTLLNNLGMVWIAVEATTLASAFLVGFYNNRGSVEASWKYIIICSAGISLALFGIILFYHAASLGSGIKSIDWTDLNSLAAGFDPKIVKIAFLFILVGFGTKAGIAPMHTWLPDAHSQAPAPVSALLSGVLLKSALYAILRFSILVNRCVGDSYTRHLFLLFGLVSLAVAAAFILIQKDVKRLLAYSTVEHIGIVAIGLGFGGTIGLYGALLHMFNHAVTKALMFFAAGRVVQDYKTGDMRQISGVVAAMPFVGVVMCIGVFALAGSPPFSIFFSEFMIALSGFKTGSWLAVSLYLLFVVIVFGAIVYHFSRMLFGKKLAGMVASAEPWTGKLVFLVLLFFIFLTGIRVPGLLNGLLAAAVAVLQGGSHA